MTRTISDSERLTQATLNRKYMEIEEKDKQIEKLQRIISCKDIQIREYQNSIKVLCNQVHDLILNKPIHD